jgi:hypothetical protein
MGHFGHQKKISCCTKTPSVSSAPQILDHVSWGHTCHHNATLKLLGIIILRPIKRAHDWKEKVAIWPLQLQHVMLSSHTQHVQPCALYVSHIPSQAYWIKDFFPLLHASCILFQSPNCVRNEGECQMHYVHVHVAVFACICLCFSWSLRLPCWLSFSSRSIYLTDLPHSLSP